MSEWMISSSILIIFVLIIRYLFRNRFAMRVRYALWLVVALRLVVPISFSESPISVLNLVNLENVAAKFTTVFELAVTQGQKQYESAATQLQSQKVYEPDEKQPEEEVDYNSIAQMNMTGQNAQVIGTGTGEKTEEPTFDYTGKEAQSGRLKDRKVSLLLKIWLAGAVLSAGVLLSVNFGYRKRVYRSRKKCRVGMKSALPVYVTPVVSTPCMFGLVHTAIYLPLQAVSEKERLKYILCHENTHYRHFDHLWVLVRAACVCIHWYNPLVWLAAGLSRQDCELACDEETLEILGEEERINYGRTLLDFSAPGDVLFGAFQLSTAMSGRKKQLKERLMLVIEQPQRYVGTLVLTAILVIVVSAATFTGKVKGQESETGDPAEAKSASAADGSEDQPKDSEKGRTDLWKELTIPMENVETASLVSIDLNDGKEYTLKIGGEVIPGDGGYRINEITLNWVHDKEEETLQTIYLEEIRCLYTRPLEEIQKSDGQMWSYSSEEEPLYAKPLYTVKDLSSYDGEQSQSDLNGKVFSQVSDGGILVADLNFDGYQDFCLQGGNSSRNIPYYCYLWNPETAGFEAAYMIPNVHVNVEEGLLESATDDGNGIQSVKYYRFDEENYLHMVRYVERNQAPDAVFPILDLTYVETSYGLPAVDEWDYGTRYGGALTERFVYWAKDALTELYEWSGTKIETACFSVLTFGDFIFGQTPSDVQASRTFYCRQYGASAGFEECIEGMDLVTERVVWYSPVTQWNVPEDLNSMTDEQLIAWYFERLPMAEGEEIGSVQSTTYENEYMVQAKSGNYYAFYLHPVTRELNNARGPYNGYPRH